MRSAHATVPSANSSWGGFSTSRTGGSGWPGLVRTNVCAQGYAKREAGIAHTKRCSSTNQRVRWVAGEL